MSVPHLGSHQVCSREIGQYRYTKCAYMSAYVHPVVSLFTSIYCSVNKTVRRVCTHIKHLSGAVLQQSHNMIFVLFAFITGNNGLIPLREGLLSRIHMDLSSRVSAGIEPGTCG